MWQEVEVWLLTGHDLPAEWDWRKDPAGGPSKGTLLSSIRGKAGVLDLPGEGRDKLAKEAAKEVFWDSPKMQGRRANPGNPHPETGRNNGREKEDAMTHEVRSLPGWHVAAASTRRSAAWTALATTGGEPDFEIWQTLSAKFPFARSDAKIPLSALVEDEDINKAV